MNDWNISWNNFCDNVKKSVKKNNLEIVFEKEIAKDFFSFLGWRTLVNEMMEQYPVTFAKATHKADIALFVNGKEKPEIIIELKRPSKKKEDKDTRQLIDYMQHEQCSYGILMLGEQIEVYYIDYSTPKHEASLVETIKYCHDNDTAHQLMEVLNRDEYSTIKMQEYCHKRVKINKTVDYWCSEGGKNEIMDMIIKRSQLPSPLLETLRTSLLVDVKRTDGLTAGLMNGGSDLASMQTTVPSLSGARPVKVWMVPANTKYFDHKACFDEHGIIYWKQYNLLQQGDIGYIYFSAPRQCIVYKFLVEACDLPYSKEMEIMSKYYTKPEDFEDAKEHNRFYRMRKIGESTTGNLTIKNLMKNDLTRAPQGTLNLSHPAYSKLLAYIEQNF